MRKTKKSTWLPCLLLIYLFIMSIIGWKGYATGQNSALFYFGSIALTLLVIWVLRHILLKKERLQREREADMDE